MVSQENIAQQIEQIMELENLEEVIYAFKPFLFSSSIFGQNKHTFVFNVILGLFYCLRCRNGDYRLKQTMRPRDFSALNLKKTISTNKPGE